MNAIPTAPAAPVGESHSATTSAGVPFLACSTAGAVPTIDEERPFGFTGMTTARWLEIAPELVDLVDLVLCQEVVSIRGLLAHAAGGESYCGDPFPHVIDWHGRRYLEDGHHRICLALLRNEPSALARVLRLPA